MRRGRVLVRGVFAGYLEERAEGYVFSYDPNYLADETAAPVSLALPLRKEPYISPVLFPFFGGLLTEGENAKLQCRILHLDEKDYFGRLLLCAGENTIGAVTVQPLEGGK